MSLQDQSLPFLILVKRNHELELIPFARLSFCETIDSTYKGAFGSRVMYISQRVKALNYPKWLNGWESFFITFQFLLVDLGMQSIFELVDSCVFQLKHRRNFIFSRRAKRMFLIKNYLFKKKFFRIWSKFYNLILNLKILKHYNF